MRDIKDKAMFTGRYHLVDEEGIIELYRKAGFDLSDEKAMEENPPDFVVNIEGSEFFFTGWKLTRDDTDYEFVVELGSNFTREELDSILPIDEDAILDDDSNPNKR